MEKKELEKTLWSAANELRGSLDASSYKDVVLGIIFLKYVSDRFESQRKDIMNESSNKDDLEDKDMYTKDNVFWIPKEARWNYIKEKAKTTNIKEILDSAFNLIEKDNPKLKGILPKTYTNISVDEIKLGKLIDLFTNLDTKKEDGDIMGQVYEYFLGEFARASGQKGGEFYTPKSIVKLLVEMISPKEGKVYDPCCGSGGMFVQANEFVKAHNGNPLNVSIYGQELNATTWRLAKMNLVIRGISFNLGTMQADTFLQDLHKDLKANYILANPPFNVKKYGLEQIEEDPRWKYGTPPKGNANYAWLQHIITKLSQEGVAAVILANGSLSTSSKQEIQIRKKMIEDGIVECIIALPDKLFYTTAIPASIWVLRRNRKSKDILFINVSDSFGKMETKKVRIFDDKDIKNIAKQYHNFLNNKLEEKVGFTKVASLDEIKENDFSLVPGMYVGFEQDEISIEDLDKKIKESSQKLIELFKEKEELEEKVLESLKKLNK